MSHAIPKNSFLHKYWADIAPVLAEIDVMIKTYDKPFSVEQAAKVLRLKKKEVKLIMQKFGLKKINKKALFCLMRNGSSEVCLMYQRELALGSPITYTKEEIAYIYGLDRHIVALACERLGINEATPLTLPVLFSIIPVTSSA